MDHVTLVTPLSGSGNVGRPKANNRYSLQTHKILWR